MWNDFDYFVSVTSFLWIFFFKLFLYSCEFFFKKNATHSGINTRELDLNEFDENGMTTLSVHTGGVPEKGDKWRWCIEG